MAGDIRAWLSGLGLVEFVEAFEENGVDWSLLPDVNNDDLKDMGVARVADRKRILKAIALLDTEFEAGVAVHPAADLSTLPGSFGPERRQVTYPDSRKRDLSLRRTLIRGCCDRRR